MFLKNKLLWNILIFVIFPSLIIIIIKSDSLITNFFIFVHSLPLIDFSSFFLSWKERKRKRKKERKKREREERIIFCFQGEICFEEDGKWIFFQFFGSESKWKSITVRERKKKRRKKKRKKKGVKKNWIEMGFGSKTCHSKGNWLFLSPSLSLFSSLSSFFLYFSFFIFFISFSISLSHFHFHFFQTHHSSTLHYQDQDNQTRERERGRDGERKREGEDSIQLLLCVLPA